MARQSWAYRVKKPKAKWSMTVMMNARDLSRDDDFLSHLLVEHLGTDDSPLQVHKMDPSRRLPKHDPAEVLAIVKKYVVRRGGSSTSAHRVKRAVDALLELNAVKQYLHKRSPAQINAFATHASRYFELYLPTGSIEISHTSRYSHRTGKSELCILATTQLKVGQVISDLKGSLAHLTAEEDEELKKTDSRRRDGGIRRDFSVIHSNQKNKSHLFLGPARFVNHDCDHNVELFRDGRVITFRVLKPISAGQEVTAHYGEGYSLRERTPEKLVTNALLETNKPEVGKGNRHCLCQTCERLCRGGYTPVEANSDEEVEDDSSTDEETREERIKAGLGLTAKGNPNERRTRRGVYAILPEEDTDDEDRVGATETVTSQVSAQTTNHGIKDSNIEHDIASETAVEISVSSLSLNSSDTSYAKPFSTLVTGDLLHKHPDGHLSDASSALTSLSDGEKTAPPTANLSTPGVAQPSQPRNPLSSTSTVKPASVGSVNITTTPVTSRMSTRSSTASQRKSNSSPNKASPAKTPVLSPSQSEKRALRSSCVPVQLQGKQNGKETPPHLVGEDAGLIGPRGRRTRHSLQFTSATPVGSVPPDTERRSFSVGGKSPTKGTKSQSAMQSVKTPQVAETPHAPRCVTCATELPHMAGIKPPKGTLHSCARCQRHFAIFTSPWPIRTGPLETFLSTSLSSDASSNENAIDVSHENLTNGSVLAKHSKYVDVKQNSVERPVKRRKTDTVMYSKARHHHAVTRPRVSSGQINNSGRTMKFLGYSHKKVAIPGGGQRSKANQTLNRLAAKGPVSLSVPSGARRKSEGTQENEDDRGNSRKRSWGEDGGELAGSRTIRHVGSLPALPVAKPYAALFARPSPNLFARKAWAIPSFNGDDPADQDDSMETSSLSDLTEPEQTPDPTSPNKAVSKATIAVLESDPSGQKRKREPTAADGKKIGRTFYMKDEKKPMPKGWVLMTDSSEETGEDDEEAISANILNADASLPGTSQLPPQATGVYQVAHSPLSMPDSVSGSTPSQTHTPSSRATSAPTQSSGTLVDDQAATPGSDKHVLITYSSRKSDMLSTVQSPKRRKLNDTDGVTLSRDKSRQISANPFLEPGFEVYEHAHNQGARTDLLKSAISLDDTRANPSALFSEHGSSGKPAADGKTKKTDLKSIVSLNDTPVNTSALCSEQDGSGNPAADGKVKKTDLKSIMSPNDTPVNTSALFSEHHSSGNQATDGEVKKTYEKSAVSLIDSPVNTSALFSEHDSYGNPTADGKVSNEVEHYSTRPLDNPMADVKQPLTAESVAEQSDVSLLQSLGTFTSPAVIMVPNPESKRAALEVSNIIHGTAFSFGFPDARGTWKPKYRFSEIHGWTSDLESCL